MGIRLPAQALLLVALLFAPRLVFAERANASAPQVSLENAVVELGRPFTFRISLRHAAGSQIVWPAAKDFGPAFEEVSRQVSERDASVQQVTSELALVLMVFDTAITALPSLPVSIKGQGSVLFSQALPLRVQGLVDLKNPQLRPMAAPVPVLVRDTRLLVMLGLVPVALLLIALGYRATRRRSPAPARASQREKSRLPPYEEALLRLAALESSEAMDRGDLKAAYLSMSEILREYLGQRFDFSALDLTTAEIRSRLQDLEEGQRQWLETAMTWFADCDLVKFAKSPADREDAEEALAAARAWMKETHKLASSPPAEAGA